MNNDTIKSLIFAVLILFLACSSPQKSLDKNNFEQAYKRSLKELKKGKSQKKNKEILSLALTEIISKKEAEKEKLKAVDQPAQQEKAIRINQALQEKIVKAIAFTEGQFDETYETLKSEEIALMDIVAGKYFQQGKEKIALSEQTKIKKTAQQAYYAFKKSKDYGSMEAQLDSLQKRSLALAQVIYHIEVNAPFNITYNWEIDRRLEDMEGHSGQFIKVYYEEITAPKNIDCNISITFSSLDIDLDEDKDDKDFEKEIVTGTKTITNSDGEEEEVDVKEEVSGTVIINTITKTAEWRVRISVDFGTKNCQVTDWTFEEAVTSKIEKIILEGDERAIPGEYKNQRDDKHTSDDDMAEELIEVIYDRIAGHIF